MKKNNQRVNKPNKGQLIDVLNCALNDYAKQNGLSNKKMACRKLGIPTSGAKVTSKQLSGYIGFVKSKLK